MSGPSETHSLSYASGKADPKTAGSSVICSTASRRQGPPRRGSDLRHYLLLDYSSHFCSNGLSFSFEVVVEGSDVPCGLARLGDRSILLEQKRPIGAIPIPGG